MITPARRAMSKVSRFRASRAGSGSTPAHPSTVATAVTTPSRLRHRMTASLPLGRPPPTGIPTSEPGVPRGYGVGLLADLPRRPRRGAARLKWA